MQHRSWTPSSATASTLPAARNLDGVGTGCVGGMVGRGAAGVGVKVARTAEGMTVTDGVTVMTGAGVMPVLGRGVAVGGRGTAVGCGATLKSHDFAILPL